MLIDINCDMGESIDFLELGHDEALMSCVSSVNIACGFHAGSAYIMQETIKNAKKHKLKIGAHPGFEDVVNFGRNEQELRFEEIKELVKRQIEIINRIAFLEGETLTHIKPHGALYNMSAKREDYAKAISEAVFEINPSLRLYGLSGSKSISEAKKIGLDTFEEVFADRAYMSDGSLSPRNLAGSVLNDLKKVKIQALALIKGDKISTMDGHFISLKADTICIHSDTPHALAFAKEIFMLSQ
jgi:UPF0271 protein